MFYMHIICIKYILKLIFFLYFTWKVEDLKFPCGNLAETTGNLRFPSSFSKFLHLKTWLKLDRNLIFPYSFCMRKQTGFVDGLGVRAQKLYGNLTFPRWNFAETPWKPRFLQGFRQVSAWKLQVSAGFRTRKQTGFVDGLGVRARKLYGNLKFPRWNFAETPRNPKFPRGFRQVSGMLKLYFLCSEPLNRK